MQFGIMYYADKLEHQRVYMFYDASIVNVSYSDFITTLEFKDDQLVYQ